MSEGLAARGGKPGWSPDKEPLQEIKLDHLIWRDNTEKQISGSEEQRWQRATGSNHKTAHSV